MRVLQLYDAGSLGVERDSEGNLWISVNNEYYFGITELCELLQAFNKLGVLSLNGLPEAPGLINDRGGKLRPLLPQEIPW